MTPYTLHTIELRTSGGNYIADYWQVASRARRTHRQLVNNVRDMWPELWGVAQYAPASAEQKDWRRWIRSLDKTSLAVILCQK